MLLGFILGPMLEENLRRALLLGRGDPVSLISSPLSAILLLIAVGLLLLAVLPAIRSVRERAFDGADD